MNPHIDGYHDLTLIGRGGFSEVYRARQAQFDRDVAVKILNIDDLDERAQRRFRRECAVTGRLSGHPHIVTVLDSGFTSTGQPYLTMEHFANGSLSLRLQRTGPLPWDDVLRIGIKVAGALEAAHREKVLHRDIKPQNILVSVYGEPALADFGISLVTNVESSMTFDAFTPVHSPPEVLEGKAPDITADIYSLASTLYMLLAGTAPYQGPPGEGIAPLLLRILREPVPEITTAAVPSGLVDLLTSALAKEPADRPPTAAAFAHALRALQVDLGEAPTDVITPTTPGLTPLPIDPDRYAGAAGRPATGAGVDPHLPDHDTALPGSTPRPATPAPHQAQPLAGAASGAVAGAAPSYAFDIAVDDDEGARTVAEPIERPDDDRPPPPKAVRYAALGVVVITMVALGILTLTRLSTTAANKPIDTIPGPPMTIDPKPAAPGPKITERQGVATLTWAPWPDKPPDAEYQVYVHSSSAPPRLADGAGTTATSFNVIAIDPTTSYCFRIFAIINGKAAMSEPTCLRGDMSQMR